MSKQSYRKMQSVFKVKKEINGVPMLTGFEVMLTDFPFDINGKMVFVFTEFDDSCKLSPCGIISVMLTKDQVSEYLEYSREHKWD